MSSELDKSADSHAQRIALQGLTVLSAAEPLAQCTEDVHGAPGYDLSSDTVKSHVGRILRKLRVDNRAEAVSKDLRPTLGHDQGRKVHRNHANRFHGDDPHVLTGYCARP
ncbi:LuxR C-terminal-related transcriptional regulator [Rhodococcoides kyotonense]|uniref:Regulatory protein, luxR family n=1 Tax=Rhodococcoides kyotonense TaxID=398843 RepID=A0A239JZH0_9NOCA|nr:LuxR C-terminal-related transcriptional regulator [Rhodococcus kyotonensis]SNT11457.1 regulatory protein, luxR family [Rhodococcus kyotonensis]